MIAGLRAAVRRSWTRIVEARPVVILLVAWAILLLYAFPGQMTQDSYDHLREA